MTVIGFEEWRRVALERGWRQDLGGWIAPNGVRYSDEFVKRVCGKAREVTVPMPSRCDHRAVG